MAIHTKMRALQSSDVPIIVNLHIRSFDSFFLTFLGPKFLHELYSGILEDPTGIAYVIESAGSINGFVAGAGRPEKLYRRLLQRRWWRFGMAALPALIRKPSILPRLVRALKMPSRQLPAEKCGTLMSIAVDPTAQGQGMGKELVRAFLSEAQKRGLEYVNLETDAINNDGVNAFYIAQGFRLHKSYTTPEGRKMNEYLIRLADFDTHNQ